MLSVVGFEKHASLFWKFYSRGPWDKISRRLSRKNRRIFLRSVVAAFSTWIENVAITLTDYKSNMSWQRWSIFFEVWAFVEHISLLLEI